MKTKNAKLMKLGIFCKKVVLKLVLYGDVP